MRVTEESIMVHYRERLTDGRLELPVCVSCGRLIVYPRAQCPHCMSVDLDWSSLSGRGDVYSYTVDRRTASGSSTPTVIGYVELAEGPRLLARIAADPDRISVGMAVRVIAAAADAPLTFEAWQASGTPTP